VLTRVPGVLGSVASRRSLARFVLTAAVFGGLLVPSAPIPAAAAATPAWLDRFNSWRASSGLSVLTENPAWSQGDVNHAIYMVKNNVITHYETPGLPYYTTDGDAAGRNSNIYVSSSTGTQDVQAIDWWMQAPFHAMGMMDPRLTQTGFGSYREATGGWQMAAAVDVLHGNPFTGGQFPVYFPGNGSTEPLRTYAGGEYPDPLQGNCAGYTAPTGLPVFVEIGGNVATTAGPVHTFIGNGTPLEHCILDSSSPNVGSNLTNRGGVVLIPRQPLQTGVNYVVTLTVNGLPYAWSFTVGSGPTGTPPPPPPPPAPLPFKGLYTLDGWGGLHGDDSPAVSVSAYWPGWKIARTAKPWPSAASPKSGLVLDGWGGLHPYGATISVKTAAYWPGWDIARDFAFLPNGTGGVVLDGWGGLHAFSVNGSTAAITIQTTAYWPGWDIARKVVIFADGTGGYVLDGWGGLHPFGINGPPPVSAAKLATTGYWPWWDIARDVVLVPGNGGHAGYVLDGWGGLHPFHPTTDGSTMPAQLKGTYWPGWDIARAVWLLPGSATAGYTLDGCGGLQPFGGSPAIANSSYWPGWDIAKMVWGA